MWALDQLYVPRSERFLAATPRVMLAALAIGAGTARLLVELAVLPPQAAGVAGVTAGHGALLATALAWTGVGGAAQVLAVALIGLAAAASHLGALGACAYAGPALWVAFLSARLVWWRAGVWSGCGASRAPGRGGVRPVAAVSALAGSGERSVHVWQKFV